MFYDYSLSKNIQQRLWTMKNKKKRKKEKGNNKET
jgi:hypothetical protein